MISANEQGGREHAHFGFSKAIKCDKRSSSNEERIDKIFKNN